MRVLILGASGLLGSNLYEDYQNLSFVCGTKSAVSENNSSADLIPYSLDLVHLGKIVDRNQIDTIVNCIGLTNIEICENLPEKAWLINASFPGHLAKFCRNRDIKFVHISTDHFISPRRQIRDEHALMEPVNQYGYTKLEGERSITFLNPQALILRVSFIGRNRFMSNDNSLLSFVLSKLKNNETFNGYSDIFFSPVSASYIGRVIVKLTELREFGIFHVGGSEALSKYDFSKRVALKVGAPTDLVQKSLSDLNESLVIRPKILALDSSKLGQYIELQDLNSALSDVLR